MKNILLLFSTFLLFLNTNAQDTIMLNNGKVIHAFITERSDTKIKYTLDSINVDTTYNLKLNRIRKIQYDNGEIDLLGSQNPRNKFPLGVNIGLATMPEYIPLAIPLCIPLMPMVGIEYYFQSNISAEVNFTIINSSYYSSNYLLSLGGKYWFTKNFSKSGFSPYAGLFYARNLYRTVEDYYLSGQKPKWTGVNLGEVPIGFSYINKSGFQSSVQLDFILSYESNKLDIGAKLIEFKIGWRFKTGKKGY